MEKNNSFSLRQNEAETNELKTIKIKSLDATQSEEEELEEIDTRTCFQKTFGKMGPGSMRGSIFNLCILSLGSGCLALPQKIGYMSLFISPIVILLAGLSNFFTLSILGNVSKKYKIKKYEDVVTKFFGERVSNFFSIVMCLNQAGMIILYQVIMYKLLGGVINEIFGYGFIDVESFIKGSFWNFLKTKFLVCYGIAICILFPLCILKSISKMRYASTFGIISLILLILIVVMECPFYIKKNFFENNLKINYIDVRPGFTKKMEFLKSVATLIYAYAKHVGVFPVLESFHNPTKKRVKQLFARATCLDMICYLIIGISGYLTQPENTPDIIIERTKIFKSDYLMTLGQFLFIITLHAKICANYNGLRTCVLNLMGYDFFNYPDKINYFITIVSLTSTTFIAVIFQSISDYISLLGSFCSVLTAVVMPGLIYIKSSDRPLYHWKNIFAIHFVVYLSIFGLMSSFFTIRTIIGF